MIYEYECPECGLFENIQTYSEYKKNPLTKCPLCSSKVDRIISASTGFVKECKTIGQLAEKNMKNMTSSQGKIFEQRIKEEETSKQNVAQHLKDNFNITKQDYSGPPPAIKKALSSGDNNRIKKYIEDGV